MSDENISTEGFTLIGEIKPSYTICFRRGGNNSEFVGKLDFNGPAMTFEGEAEESAKVFFDWLAQMFERRLKEERKAEREACAKVCEDEATKCEKAAQDCIENGELDEVSAVRSTGWKLMVCAAAIRARGQDAS